MTLAERPKPFRDSSLVVLGFEGEESGEEYQYFQQVLEIDVLDHRRVRFVFVPASTIKHDSDPESTLARVKQYIERHPLHSFDQVWIVVDVDSWHKWNLAAVAGACRAASYSFAVSNSCFEFWLLFHNPMFDTHSLSVVGERGRSAAAKKAWAQNKVVITCEAIVRACETARVLSRDGTQSPWPQCPGSDVFRVFDDLCSRNVLSRKMSQLLQP